MNLLDSLAVGLRALSVNKMRSMLTVLGIIIGVAAVVCMVSVGSGAREEVAEKIRTLGANLLLIRPGAQLSGGARLDCRWLHRGGDRRLASRLAGSNKSRGYPVVMCVRWTRGDHFWCLSGTSGVETRSNRGPSVRITTVLAGYWWPSGGRAPIRR